MEIPKISVRPLQLSDVDDFMAWASDPKVAQFCSWDPYTSKQDALTFIHNSVLPHPWFRAICLDGTPVGAIFVTKNTGGDACRGELGFHLASGCWGRGIATAAVKMAAEVIFVERPELERVEAVVDVDNVRSQRVLEKAGFVREGVMRRFYVMKGRCCDFVMFSFLKRDQASVS